MGVDALERWLTALRDRAADEGAGRLLAGLAVALGVPDGALVSGAFGDPAPVGPPPPPVDGPDLLGMVFESMLGRPHRRRHGAFFTPRAVAEGLTAIAAPTRPGPFTVCDPACGGGAFLLASARGLEARGVSRATVVADLVWGIDLDPMAVAVSEAALALWAADRGGAPPAHVVAGDALTAGLGAWEPRAERFDLVIGNPPFQSQLAARTARSADQTRLLRARVGPAVVGYADTATLFVVAAIDLAADGGAVALVVPESFLTARDARPARDAVLDAAELRALWIGEEPIFDAAVRVCAPVLRVGRTPEDDRDDHAVRRFVGAGVAEVEPAGVGGADLAGATTWAILTADRRAPRVQLDEQRRLATLASATAGFRDQYYGLVGHVIEEVDGDASRPRLVTSGLVDPARSLWGRRDAQFAKRRWRAPRVDLEALRAARPEVARWGESLLVPKVLVATQTRVLEAFVDEEGTSWPSVPVIAVVAPRERLWHVAAAVLSPPATAWALAHFGGGALSGEAIKLAANQLLALPLPVDGDGWDEGAASLRDAATAALADDASGWRDGLLASGAAMCAAYGQSADLTGWWASRLPPFR